MWRLEQDDWSGGVEEQPARVKEARTFRSAPGTSLLHRMSKNQDHHRWLGWARGNAMLRTRGSPLISHYGYMGSSVLASLWLVHPSVFLSPDLPAAFP